MTNETVLRGDDATEDLLYLQRTFAGLCAASLPCALVQCIRDTERITQIVGMMVGDVWYGEQALQAAYTAVTAFLAERSE